MTAEWRTGREDMQSYDGATGEPFASVYADDPNGEIHMGERVPRVIAKTFGSDCKENARRCAAAPEMAEALRSEALFLRRFLEKLTHHSVTGANGQIVNGYAAAEVPDWEMRQRLDDIEAAIAKAEGR